MPQEKSITIFIHLAKWCSMNKSDYLQCLPYILKISPVLATSAHSCTAPVSTVGSWRDVTVCDVIECADGAKSLTTAPMGSRHCLLIHDILIHDDMKSLLWWQALKDSYQGHSLPLTTTQIGVTRATHDSGSWTSMRFWTLWIGCNMECQLYTYNGSTNHCEI